jgi:hypothetical protein
MSQETLVNLLTGPMSYNDSWAIYAERIDGEFKPDSRARFASSRFKNGRSPDNFTLFASNRSVIDFFDRYLEGMDIDEIGERVIREAALELINDMNERAED